MEREVGMPDHEQFEQLCALAAAGELDGHDAEALAGHLEDCGACRALLSDFGEIHASWLPAHPAFDIVPDTCAEARLRQTILRCASAEGAQFSEAAILAKETKWGKSKLGSFYLRFCAVSALILLCALLFISLLRTKAEIAARKDSPPPTWTQSAAGQGGRSETANHELAEANERNREAEHSVNALRLEVARLRNQLKDAESALSATAEGKSATENRVALLEKQLETGRNDLAQREAELERAKSSASTNEAVAIAEQQEIDHLHSEAAAKTASLQREREMLSAGREIRDLIAARNLHIIDVYDTNADGKTSKAFGRVFYTEGKSLVFYAYDLTAHHANNAKFAFYVWGKRDGAPQYVKVLGQLNKDDQQQKRWALTVTDPNVLAEIDSVFVTLEPATNGAGKPTGRPLLSAFLGSPANHP
jgi:hypothetical protein